MRADRAVFVLGLLLVVAAVAGGAVSGAGLEIPVLAYRWQQLGLGVVGMLVMLASLILKFSPAKESEPVLDGESAQNEASNNLRDFLGDLSPYQSVEVTIKVEGSTPPTQASSRTRDEPNDLRSSSSDAPSGHDADADIRFYNMERELEQLRAEVLSGLQSARSIVEIVGRGGVGKTMLVEQYLKLHGSFFGEVLRLGPEADADIVARASSDSLIVIDDVAYRNDALLTAVRMTKSTVLITSRVGGLFEGASRVIVGGFSLETASEMLLQEMTSSDATSAVAIGNALQGSPLLISLSIAYMRQESLTLGEYLERYLQMGSGSHEDTDGEV